MAETPEERKKRLELERQISMLEAQVRGANLREKLTKDKPGSEAYAPVDISGFEKTRPYAFLDPFTPLTRPGTELGLIDALRPQTKSPDESYISQVLDAARPGAGLLPQQRSEIEEKYAETQKLEKEQYRKELRTKGKPEKTLRPGYLNLSDTTTPPATAFETKYKPIAPDEIESEVERRFPTGFVPGTALENPVSWGSRLIFAPMNAVAGALGYLITPAAIQKKKEAARPLATSRPGIGGNIAQAIASQGMSGMTEQLYDAFDYSDNYKSLAPFAGAAGFLLDLGGYAGEGLVGGVAGGIKGLREATVVAKAAKTGAKSIAPALTRGAQGALKGFADQTIGTNAVINLIENKSGIKLTPGDIRLTLGSGPGMEATAAERYRYVRGDRLPTDDAATAAAKHDAALKDIKEKYGNTKFVKEVEQNPDIPLDDYLPPIDEVLKTNFKTANRAANKIIDGKKLDSFEQLALKPYLSTAIKTDTKLARILSESRTIGGAWRAKPISTISALLDTYRSRPDADDADEVVKELATKIKELVAIDIGVSIADKALADAGLRGGAGFKMATPNTIILEKDLPVLLKEYKDSGLYKEFLLPAQSGGDLTAGIKTLRESTARARIKGDITYNEAEKVYDFIDDQIGGTPVSKASDIISENVFEKVQRSLIDDIARQNGIGISTRTLSPIPVPKKVINTPTARFQTGQELRRQEITSDVPLLLKRASTNWKTKYITGAEELATEDGKRVIREARGAIASLDKKFRSEFTAIKESKSVREEYGLREDPTDSEIIFAMGIGRGEKNKKELAEAIVRSMIFKSDVSPIKAALTTAFSPEFSFGVPAGKADEEVRKIVEEIVGASITDIKEIYNGILVYAKKAAEKSTSTLTESSLGRTFTAGEKDIDKVLIAAYGDVKGKEIIANAISKAVNEIPGTLSDRFSQVKKIIKENLSSVVGLSPILGKKPITDASINDFYYDMMKLRIKQDAGLINLTEPEFTKEIEKLAKESFGVEDEKDAAFLADALKNSALQDVMQQTLDLAKASGIYVGRTAEKTIENIELLQKNNVQFGNFGQPALVNQLLRELGGAPNITQMKTELAMLSRTASEDTKAGKAALYISNKVRQAFDAANSLFYNAILSYAPKFHTGNIATAPAITYYTTGSLSGFRPDIHLESAKILNTGRPGLKIRGGPLPNREVERSVVAVTDAYGRKYTRGELYDAAITGGALRSQSSSVLPGNFIKDTEEFAKKFSSIKNPLTPGKSYLGTPFAEYTDNVFRMSVIQEALKAGKSLDEALDLGRKSLYDYGTITDTERKFVSATGWIFYNYMRNSVLTYLKNLVTNPGRIFKQMRIESAIGAGLEKKDKENLSFYYPDEYMNGRPVVSLMQGLNKTDSRVMLGPSLPYADGALMLSKFFASPKAFLLGPELAYPKYGGPSRDYEEGFLYKGIGPVRKAIYDQVVGGQLDNVKLTKNKVAPEHAAALSLVPSVRDVFYNIVGPVDEVTAEKGAKNFNGKEYRLTEEGFERYAFLLKAAALSGIQRPMNDYTRLIAGLGADEPTGLGPQGKADAVINFLGPLTITSPMNLASKTESSLKDEKRKKEEEKAKRKKSAK